MKRLILGFAILPVMLICSVVAAQDLDKLQKPGDEVGVDDQVAQTEDMWFYLQELRRYETLRMQSVARRNSKANSVVNAWRP